MTLERRDKLSLTDVYCGDFEIVSSADAEDSLHLAGGILATVDRTRNSL